jgi:hypothetical protein
MIDVEPLDIVDKEDYIIGCSTMSRRSFNMSMKDILNFHTL